jgi:flagellar motility protein MotE (MotC chaperone)
MEGGEMSDTPRTDAVDAYIRTRREFSITDHQVWQEHGEHLERELNEANKTNRLQYELITTAEKRGVDKSKEELNRLNDRIKQLEAKVDELHDLEKWLEGR